MAHKKFNHPQELFQSAKIAHSGFCNQIEDAFFQITLRKIPTNTYLSKFLKRKFQEIPPFELKKLLTKIYEFSEYGIFSNEKNRINLFYKFIFFIDCINSFAVKIELQKQIVKSGLGPTNHWLDCHSKNFKIYGYLFLNKKTQQYTYELHEVDPIIQECDKFNGQESEKQSNTSEFLYFLGSDFELKSIVEIIKYLIKNLKFNKIKYLVFPGFRENKKITVRTDESEEILIVHFLDFYHSIKNF
jgi:hypothetical protein